MNKKVLVPGIIAIVLIVTGIAAFIIISMNRPAEKLARKLAAAREYLNEMDYEQARAAYDAAIHIDPKCEEAYLGKAEAQEGLGDYEGAIDTLADGFVETDSTVIRDELENTVEERVNELVEVGEIGDAINLMERIQEQIGDNIFEEKIDAIIMQELNDEGASETIADEQTGALAAETETMDAAMQAFYTILSAMPAAEMNDDDFYDAAFSSDENIAKYGSHIEYAVVRDLNMDGMPELICMTLYNFRWENITIYSYIDGQAVLVGELDNRHTAAGAYNTYVCGDGHIHNVWSGTDPMGNYVEELMVYQFDGRNLVETTCEEKSTGNPADDFYQMNYNDESYRETLIH